MVQYEDILFHPQLYMGMEWVYHLDFKKGPFYCAGVSITFIPSLLPSGLRFNDLHVFEALTALELY